MSFSDLEVLRSFQNQIAAIQRDAVWWLHTVVPSISKLAPKDYVHWYGPGSLRLDDAPESPAAPSLDPANRSQLSLERGTRARLGVSGLRRSLPP